MERGNQSHHFRRFITPVFAAIAGVAGFGAPEQAHAQNPDAYPANYAPPYDGAVRIDAPGDSGDLSFIGLTAVNPEAPGYASLYGGDSDGKAVISHVNFAPGTVMTNTAAAEVGNDGSLIAKNSVHGPVDLIADHKLTIDGNFFSPAPYRMFDSRNRGRPLAPGETVCLPTQGDEGESALLNVTLVTEGATGNNGGFVTAYPGNANKIPETSNLNYVPDQKIPSVNEVIVQIGPNDSQEVCLRNSDTDSVHLIADSQGTLSSETFIPTPSKVPERLVDTRIGQGGNRLAPGARLDMYVNPNYAGHVAILNITSLNESGPGYGVVYGGNEPKPETSDVNYSNDIRPGIAFARVANDGRIIYENSNHSWTDVAVDVLGFFNGNRAKDTRHIRLVDTREMGSKVNPDRPPQLFNIPYNPNAIIPAGADLELNLIHSRVPYGPHPAQYIDVYESKNHKDRAAANDGAIEWLHGGGWSGGDNLLNTPYDNIARYMAANHGYTLFSINYRLTTEVSFADQINDVILADRFIQNNAASFGINPRDRFIGGASAGATDALVASSRNNDTSSIPPRGLLLFAPMLDGGAWGIDPIPGAEPFADLNRLVGVSPTAAPAINLYSQQLNFAASAPKNLPPVFIAFSPQDNVIPFVTQQAAIAVLAQSGFVVLNTTGPDGHVAGHGTDIGALHKFMNGR